MSGLDFGKSSGKSSSKTTFTPNSATASLFNPLFNQAQNLLGQEATPYTGPFSAGTSPLQQKAYDTFQPGMGQGATGSAIDAAKGLLGYTPSQVSAGQLASTDLNPYMNPFTNDVIDASTGDLNRARQQQINSDSGAFSRAGAWGGSRQGVADAQTNDAFLRNVASNSANLRSQGYNTALQAAQQDIAARMQADLANQNAGLQGAQFGLQGAGLLGQLGQQQQAMGLADTNALATLGQQQQDTAQRDVQARYADFLRMYQDPFQREQAIQGLLGSLPALFAGATQKGSGKQSGYQIGWSGGGSGGAQSGGSGGSSLSSIASLFGGG